MNWVLLPVTPARSQALHVALPLGGQEIRALVELRYLPAPDVWVLSVRDDATGERWAEGIPLLASRGPVNDLFRPFRYLRQGRGLGCLVVISAGETPSTPDPSADNLTEFLLLWGDG